MAINFPASPSTNDTHTENAITWIFNGTSWDAQEVPVTAASIGLGSVDNTSDADKPVSTATQAALDDKQGVDLSLTYFDEGDPTGASSSSDEIHDFLAGLDAGSVAAFKPGSVYLCKNIKIPSNIIIHAYGCRFDFGGSNPSNWVASPENSQSGIFQIYGTESTPAENIRINGGEYVGVRPAGDWSTYGTTDAIQIAWANNVHIKDATIRDWEQDAIEFKGCNDSSVTGCYILDCVDAGVEARGGKNISVRNNHFLRTRNAFMVKPFVKSGGGTQDGFFFNFSENECECFGNTILNNWANYTTILNNAIKPVAVTGENGLDQAAIVTQYHPTAAMNDNTMDGMVVEGNRLYGDTTNTFIRQLGDGSTNYGENTYVRNQCLDSCDKGLDIVGASVVRGNYIKECTNATQKWALAITPNEKTTIEGNSFLSGSIKFYAGHSGDANVLLSDNLITTLNLDLCNFVVTGNAANKIKSNSTVLSVICTGNSINQTSSSTSALEIDGDDGVFTSNKITKAGGSSSYAVKLTGSRNTVANNHITTTSSSSGSVIQSQAGADDNLISANYIDAGTSTGSCVRVYGDHNMVTNNRTKGGNQGARVYGSQANIIGNTFQDTNYQHLDIKTGAVDTMIDHNTKKGSGSGLADAGTGTINGGTNRGF
jgi:hypothetical protein